MLASANNVLRNFIDAESVGATGIFGAFLVYAGRPSGPTSCCRGEPTDVRWNLDFAFRRPCDDDEREEDVVADGCGGGGGGGARDGGQANNDGRGDGHGDDCEGESDRLRVCFVRPSARLLCMTSW